MPALLGRVPSPPDHRDYSVRRLADVRTTLEALPWRYMDRSARRMTWHWDQQEGSCVGRATGRAKIVEERKDHHRTFAIDPLWIWLRAKEIDGLGPATVDRGTYIRSALKILHDRGAALEPGSKVGARWGESRFEIDAYYACQTLDEIKAAIKARGPVVLGSWWFSEWWDTLPNGALREPNLAHDVGGHATMAFGWDDRVVTWAGPGVIWADNSWSNDWGVRGRFAIPYPLLGGADGAIGSSPFDEAWRLEDRLDEAGVR